MSWMWTESGLRLLVGLAAGVSFLVAGLIRERQTAPKKPWRYAVVVLVALALLLLIVQPTWTRRVDGVTALVLTPGARAEALLAGTGELAPTVLSAALPGAEPWSPQTDRVPDLATWLRNHPQIAHLQIAGEGLEPWDLAGLSPSVEVVGRADRHSGVRSAHWNRHLELGDWLELTGNVSSVEAGALTLELEGPGGTCAGIELAVEVPGRPVPFSLRCQPPGEGRFLYQLEVKGSSASPGASEIVDVQVSPAEIPSVLWLEDAPSFEAKYFKRWIAEAGGELAIRSRVSRDRFHFEYHNLERFELRRLSSEMLERFDLVVVAQRAWESLSEVEKSVLTEAAETQALGLLFRVDPDGTQLGAQKWPLEFAAERVTDSDRLLVQVEGLATEQIPALETGPFELVLEPGMEPVFEDRSGRVLAAARPLGEGTVGITLLDKTYPWVLEGYGKAQRQIWRRLIEVVARPNRTPTWHLRPGPILVDEPLDLSLDWDPDAKLAPPAEFGAIRGSLASLPLRRDSQRSGRWTARVWPSAIGWHRVTAAGATLDLYVDETESWSAWRQARRQRATELASLRPPSTLAQTSAIAELPVPRLPLFLVLLAGLGLLWLDERR